MIKRPLPCFRMLCNAGGILLRLVLPHKAWDIQVGSKLRVQIMKVPVICIIKKLWWGYSAIEHLPVSWRMIQWRGMNCKSCRMSTANGELLKQRKLQKTCRHSYPGKAFLCKYILPKKDGEVTLYGLRVTLEFLLISHALWLYFNRVCLPTELS